MRDGSTGGIHALAAGVKPRSSGQGRGDGVRGDRGGRGSGSHGKRDGKGHQYNHQQQWASQPSTQCHQQQWALHPPRIIISSSGLHSPPRSIISIIAAVGFTAPHAPSAAAAFSAAATVRTAPWRGVTIASLFPLRPARVFLCRECRAIHPAPLNTCPPAPSYTAQQGDPHANCSSNSPGDYVAFREETTNHHNNSRWPCRRPRMNRRYPPPYPETPRTTGL